MVDFENITFEVSDLGVKWHNFGVSKCFYKVCSILLLFAYSTLSFKISENLYSGFQEKKMLGFGSNLGFLWKCLNWSLLPLLFTYFDLSSSKSVEKNWADSQNKVNNYFWENFCPIYSLSNSNHFTSAKKMPTRKLYNRFHVAKNWIRVGDFQKLHFSNHSIKRCCKQIISIPKFV